MPTRQDVAELFRAAVTSGDEASVAALEAALSDDVMSVSPMGRPSGREAVLAALANPAFRPMLASGQWSEPGDEDDAVALTCTFPEGSRLRALTFRLVFADDGRVLRIEQQMLPGTPPPPAPITLTDEMKAAINGALAGGNPILVTYVDAAGRPKMSYRGTVQAYSDDQLALWNRDPNGGMGQALKDNPNLAFYLRDTTRNVQYLMYGRGHVDHEPAVRDVVFTNSPEREQNFDFARRGIAIVVDLDRIEGAGPGGRVAMARPAGT